MVEASNNKRRGGDSKQEQGRRRGKWSMPGSSVGPGSVVVVAGNYVVGAVHTQVILQRVVGSRYGWGSIFAGEGQTSQAGCKVVSCKGGLQD